MENFKIETKAEGQIITISALTEKTHTIKSNGFSYEKKYPAINEIARFKHNKSGKTTKVCVISSPEITTDDGFYNGVSGVQN